MGERRPPSIPYVPLVDLRAVFAANPQEFILKTLGAVMLFLIADVLDEHIDV
jgi:hypothetical protein